MTAQRGDLFLLKIGDGGTPAESFTTIGGLKLTAFALNNKPLVSNNLESGGWQKITQGGIKEMQISGSGIFTDSAAEESLRAAAFSGEIKNYKISFGNGDNLSGAFAIDSFTKSGNYIEEELYSIGLSSAGEITYAAG